MATALGFGSGAEGPGIGVNSAGPKGYPRDELSPAFLGASSDTKGLFGLSMGPDLVIRWGMVLLLSPRNGLDGCLGFCSQTGSLLDSLGLEYP